MTTLNSRLAALEQSIQVADWHPAIHVIERDWNETDEAAKARIGIDPKFPDVTVIVVKSHENH